MLKVNLFILIKIYDSNETDLECLVQRWASQRFSDSSQVKSSQVIADFENFQVKSSQK
jgi:hypothetical protein